MEKQHFLQNRDKQQPKEAMPQPGQSWRSLHWLEHLSDFCEFWESLQLILEWPVKISTLSLFFFFSLILLAGHGAGATLKSKRLTQKSAFPASFKARSSGNTGSGFLSDSSVLELSSCCFLRTGPKLPGSPVPRAPNDLLISLTRSPA